MERNPSPYELPKELLVLIAQFCDGPTTAAMASACTSMAKQLATLLECRKALAVELKKMKTEAKNLQDPAKLLAALKREQKQIAASKGLGKGSLMQIRQFQHKTAKLKTEIPAVVRTLINLVEFASAANLQKEEAELKEMLEDLLELQDSIPQLTAALKPLMK